MFDSASLRLISGFLGLLILGFVVFLVAGTVNMSGGGSEVSSNEASGSQNK
jgi:hypothetical protein